MKSPQEVMQQVVEKLNLPIDEVQNKYNELLADMQKFYPEGNEQGWQEKATKNLITFYRTNTAEFKNTKKMQALVYAISPVQYSNRGRIEKAVKAYIENPQEAITSGIVKLDQFLQPIAIDTSKTFGAKGGKNPNFGQPLNPDSQRKNVFVLAVVDGVLKKAMFDLKNENVNYNFPLNTPIEMNPSVGIQNDKPELPLYMKKNFRIQDGQSATQEETYNLIRQNVEIVHVKDIEKIAKHAREKKLWNVMVGVEGVIADMKKGNDGLWRLTLTEESDDLTDMNLMQVKVSEELGYLVDFGVYSKVLVIGAPWVMGEGEENKLIGLNAFNILCSEKIKVDVQPVATAPTDAVGGAGSFSEFNTMRKVD